ncbi:hypothetical protein OU426_12735 [Frigidibacter sp. RF13]|uniref:hypothetical protein n=1 Tax=Frigidibacter sp. RF13 TaxID=2997340 RepID=UPI002271DE4F|nr:hypothetical protein [Frigidibacter sp. RF13]MCY1127722.1 hypothetical protein [Frigidibacter sp. RF13]
MSDVDWGPWLQPDERIVWQGRKENRSTALGALGVLALFVALPYFNDGSERVQLAVKAAPWIVVFIIASLLYMAFHQAYYAITQHRALLLSTAPWRKPRLESIRLAEAEAVKHPRTPLIFLHRQTRKPVVQMWLGQTEADHVLSIIKSGSP